MAEYDALDLFAGPGGWDEGARQVGITTLGFEWDAAACATARAAGHPRVQADIATLNPLDYPWTPGEIASPPCQGFSQAGSGRGHADAVLLLEAIRGCRTGEEVDLAIKRLHASMTDDRSVLVLEPLRWALYREPEWMAWEQVVPVRPIWEACADVLRAAGYQVAVGVVQADHYGVPQARRRAVLLAHRSRSVKMPRPLPPVLWGTIGKAVRDLPAGTLLRSNYSAPQTATARTAQERGRTMRAMDEPSVTITSKRPQWQFPDGTRMPLSLLSMTQLQGFRDDYPWQGSVPERRQQIGDAVPPALAAALLRQVV